jgi:thiazoline dehydrogenase / protease
MNESNLARLLVLADVETVLGGENIVKLSGPPGLARTSGEQSKWSVPPLAEMTGLAEGAQLQEPPMPSQSLCLSRFAYLRPLDGSLVLESPLSEFRITLTDPRAGSLLSTLSEPRPLGELEGLPVDLVRAFMQLLWGGGFLTAGTEPAEVHIWNFHNLVFHASKRWRVSAAAQPRTRNPNAGTFPVTKPPMSANCVLLPSPDLNGASGGDQTLTAVMEARRSIRHFDDERPITLQQLGELLYRAARVKSIFKSEDKFGHLPSSVSADQETTLSARPYPSSGARYELELYPVVRRCAGLNSGLYHYDPLNHRLEQLKDARSEALRLIEDAFKATGREGMAQVLFVVAARFGRMFQAYPDLGYELILKDVGVLYQNLYLVATAMGLAPCALGEGDVERFSRAAGLKFLEESMLGGFIVGTASDGRRDLGSNEEVAKVVGAGLETPSIVGADADIAATGAIPAVTPVPTIIPEIPARHPHDLDNRLPGLSALRDTTLGDSRVTIVVLDGDPDLELSCFRGGDVSKKYPFWHDRAEPITAEQHALYRQISESNLKPDEAQRQLEAAVSPSVLNRIVGDRHATHVASTIVGQPGSPAPGIAPGCRMIVVPLNEVGDSGEFMSVLNLARGFELARELGAHIIHCAVCLPTQTDEPHKLLARVLRGCLDDSILVVAPVGNDGGECRCFPAVLPDVLAVGALRDDGRPFKFNNWGGNYSNNGLMALGERILGAQPRTEQPIRLKGTSLAAPVVTGVAALLISRQLQAGRQIDPLAVRDALLGTARACDPAAVEEPERCLRGVIDVPHAIDSLFGSPGGISASSNLKRVFGSAALAAHSDAARRLSADAPPKTDNVEMVARSAVVPAATAVSRAPASPNTETALASPSTAFGTDSVTQSTAHSGLVYAIGRLSFDLGSENWRQTLEQRMAQAVQQGQLSGANPNEPRDLTAYLERNPAERRFIIWTLEIDGAPIYALEPMGPFAESIYEIFLQLLTGETLAEDADEFIERVSIPAQRAGRTVELLSGAKVPVIRLTNLRGIYGWQINALAPDAVTAAVPSGSGQEPQALRDALADFLKRVYFERHNYGLTSRDRAVNFAATNCFQAASAFARALAGGRVLKTIVVDKSPNCRMHSDCWELYLDFYDPNDRKRAIQVFQFTIDVSDIMPVTVGTVKSWMKPCPQ